MNVLGRIFPPKLTVAIQKGKRGHWRWKALDKHGGTVAVAPVRGFDTPEEAERAAKAVFAHAVGRVTQQEATP